MEVIIVLFLFVHSKMNCFVDKSMSRLKFSCFRRGIWLSKILLVRQADFPHGNLFWRSLYGMSKRLVMKEFGAFLVSESMELFEPDSFAFLLIILEKMDKIFQFHSFFVLIYWWFWSFIVFRLVYISNLVLNAKVKRISEGFVFGCQLRGLISLVRV